MNKKNYLSSMFFLITVFLTTLSFSAEYEIKEVNGKQNKLFSIECRDIEIKDLLRAIAKENGLNLIISDDISGKVTLSFEKISLSDALDAILKAHKLDYVIKNDIMRVVKEEELKKKEEEAKKEEQAKEEKKEYVTKVIGLSYADAGKLKSTIQETVPEGTISSDERTNSILINADEKNVNDIKKVIGELDTETKQIMIKAKIVETTSDFSKELGVQWGGTYYRDPATGHGFSAHGFPNAVNIAGSSGSGTYAVNLPAATPTSGIGMNLGSIGGNVNLDLRISAMEKSGKIHVVSKPHITTLNNKPAKIHSGITFRVRTSSEVTTTTSTTTDNDLEEIKAGIDLIVTPKITKGDLIELNIDVTKSEPDFTKVVDGIPGIIDKNANTTVLVKNGETTVIGGLKKDANSEVENSVPFFSKIPVLGWLFKSKANVDSNEELLIFITPVLINNKTVSSHQVIDDD